MSLTEFTEHNLRHLLRRTEFVVRPERLAALLARGSMEAAVDDVLAIDGQARNGRSPTPDFDFADTSGGNWPQYARAAHWWIDYAARGYSAEQGQGPPPSWRAFQEKMVLFWHGHFVTSWSQIHIGTHLMWQLHSYRRRALGNLRDLAQEMAVSPAMLVYLSNAFSVAGEPNQNFARELMELFTLGVGNYTEADVDAVARAWTGHNYRYEAQAYVFNDALHDNGSKTLFGITRPWDGPQVIDELIHGSKRPVTARFIARKLWDHLAYPGPSDAIVTQLADTFVANGMAVRPLVRAILLRDEFYGPAARQGLVRTPLEWIVAVAYHTGITGSALRLVDVAPADPAVRVSRSELTGQLIYQPPNVSGWRPNGYWLTASGLSGRARLAEAAVDFALGPETSRPFVAPGTVGPAVDAAAAYLGADLPPGGTTRSAIVAAFGDEGAPFGAADRRDLLLATMLCPEMHLA